MSRRQRRHRSRRSLRHDVCHVLGGARRVRRPARSLGIRRSSASRPASSSSTSRQRSPTPTAGSSLACAKRTSASVEDGQEQQITHFNSERVPVSLGLVVDTSGSMEGEKWVSARQALNRFLFQLLDRDDEVFLYRFDNQPELIETWTTDRERIATRAGPDPAPRRHIAVRRGGVGGAARADRASSKEGDRRDLGRQRHEQPRHDSRDQSDDPID